MAMPELGNIVEKIRSKNAGPFWLTIDIFCGGDANFHRVCKKITTEKIAELFKSDIKNIKRFDIESLNVIKFSLPRPVVQGTRQDRDMHGAGWAVLLEELEID